MVNPRNKLRIQSNLQYLPQNTPCSCIDYLIIFLPQESSHSPTASWDTPFYSILGALNSNFSLFWVCCAGQDILGGCCAQVHCEILSQFNTIYVDHLLLSGRQREGGVEAFIKPSSSFIFGNLHIATVNFHLLL